MQISFTPLLYTSYLLLSILQLSDTKRTLQCQTSSQCGPSSCCVLVYTRHGTTSCEALRRVGEQCHPLGQQSLNISLGLPSGSSTTLTDVYQSLCPCEAGAVCIRGTCATRDLTYNHL